VIPTVTYADLLELMKSLFKSIPLEDWDSVKIRYLDDENDLCSVTGELELREAFHAKKQDVLKLEITFRKAEGIKLLPKIEAEITPIQQQERERPWGCHWRDRQDREKREEKRSYWPQGCNQRRLQLLGLHEEGIALMEAKQFEAARAVFVKQAEMLRCPWKKSIPHYNIACCEALLGNVDAALASLALAISCGYRNVQHIEEDADLVNLRGLEAFQVMLDDLRGQPSPSCGERKGRWGDRERCKKGNFGHCNRNTTEVAPCETTPMEEQKPEVLPVTVEEKPLVEESKPVEAQLPVEEKPAIDLGSASIPFAAEMHSLQQMGFTNVQKNARVLARTRGNLQEAVVMLLR